MDVVCNQTNYTEAEAIEKLALFGDDPIAVIRDYLKIRPVVVAVSIPHQTIYKEIGKFMEDKYKTVGK